MMMAPSVYLVWAKRGGGGWSEGVYSLECIPSKILPILPLTIIEEGGIWLPSLPPPPYRISNDMSLPSPNQAPYTPP